MKEFCDHGNENKRFKRKGIFCPDARLQRSEEM